MLWLSSWSIILFLTRAVRIVRVPNMILKCCCYLSRESFERKILIVRKIPVKSLFVGFKLTSSCSSLIVVEIGLKRSPNKIPGTVTRYQYCAGK